MKVHTNTLTHTHTHTHTHTLTFSQPKIIIECTRCFVYCLSSPLSDFVQSETVAPQCHITFLTFLVQEVECCREGGKVSDSDREMSAYVWVLGE